MASVSFIEGSNGRNGLKASGTAAQANATTDSRPATIGLDSLQATEISPASKCGALAEYPCEALCGLQVPENVSAGFALCTTATRHVNVTRGTDIHSARILESARDPLLLRFTEFTESGVGERGDGGVL
jgi:hypothetical protein